MNITSTDNPKPRRRFLRFALVALILLVVAAPAAWRWASQAAPNQNLSPAGNDTTRPPVDPLPAQPQHPLAPAIQIARAALENIQTNVKDYTATLVKRERVNGKLNEPESMFLKVRQEPFSVYMGFVTPERLKGQEVIYVAGQNGGNMLAHGVGLQKLIGMIQLAPTSPLAMAGQRYPITEIGIENLTRRLIEAAEQRQSVRRMRGETHQRG